MIEERRKDILIKFRYFQIFVYNDFLLMFSFLQLKKTIKDYLTQFFGKRLTICCIYPTLQSKIPLIFEALSLFSSVLSNFNFFSMCLAA